jgi:DNA replication protein DnaC
MTFAHHAARGMMGKTHLAGALGYAACFQRKRALFTTTSKLVSELIGSHESGRLRHFYHRLDRLDLLIVDEMRYGRFSVSLNAVTFQDSQGGVVMTTTIPQEKWGEVFESESSIQRLP